MIDIHTHILPDVDDGAYDLETALTMAEMAVESGVTAIAVTPHCNIPGRFDNYWGITLRDQIRSFQQALQRAGIKLAIFSGMEVFGMPNTAELLRAGKLTTLGGSQYLLIEFPFWDYAQQATDILCSVAALGYCPVVAHPERYHYVQKSPELLNRWIDLGCLLQMNKGSLFGCFGRGTQALSLSMLDRGFAAAVASDAHSVIGRTTWMRDIWDLLEEEYSESTAQLLLQDNPQKMLMNTIITMPEPDWF